MSGSRKVAKYKAQDHLVKIGGHFGVVTGVMNRAGNFAYEVEGVERLVGEAEIEAAYVKVVATKRVRKPKAYAAEEAQG